MGDEKRQFVLALSEDQAEMLEAVLKNILIGKGEIEGVILHQSDVFNALKQVQVEKNRLFG